MATPDGRYVLSYNGEVYNFRELRARAGGARRALSLARRHRGRPARARPVGARGAVAVQRHVRACASGTATSDGCCSPATGTASSRCTTSKLGDTFLFGSEIKALLAHPGYRVEVDREALVEYFTFQNFFTTGPCSAASRCCRPGP